MALTQDEERADKLSDEWEKSITDVCDILKNDPSLEVKTKNLYKFRGRHTDACWWKVSGRVDGTLNLTRETADGKSYPSILKGTKTLSAIDRLWGELKKRATKCLRNAWTEQKGAATTVSQATLKKPMLLHKWEKQKHKIIYPCIVQPKHDGIRAMYDYETKKLYSRSGKVIDLPHITDALEGQVWIDLDGELAFDDWTVPLPEVIHAIAHKHEAIKYHVFDQPDPDELFNERFIKYIGRWMQPGNLGNLSNIRIAQTLKAMSQDQVDTYYTQATEAGWEGIVVRNLGSPYEFGHRTMQTLKYKFEIESKFQIHSYQIIPHPGGALIMFVCVLGDQSFEVVPAWTHEDRRDALKYFADIYKAGSYIGNLPEILVEYRGITEVGKPFHAVAKTPWKALQSGLRR
jgi:hypothetical protein